MSTVQSVLRARSVAALGIALAATTCGAAGADGIPCSYDVTVVEGPTVPPFGQMKVDLYDMNDAGVAVGAVWFVNPQPCIWTAEGGVKVIPMPFGTSSATLVGINNNGWIIANTTAGGVQYRGQVLIPNGPDAWVWVPMAAASGPLGWSWVADINDKNQVVGTQSMGMGEDYLYPYGGFLWSLEAGRTDIQTTGWMATECRGINDAGSICGNVSQGGVADLSIASVRAFALMDSGLTIVEPISPYVATEARDINALNIVAGNARTTVMGPATKFEGFLFAADTAALTMLPITNGYYDWVLYGVNDAGVACGALRAGQSSDYQPCIASVGAVIDLKSLVDDVTRTVMGDVARAIHNNGLLNVNCDFKCDLVFSPSNRVADLDCDGTVSKSDIAALLAVWGTSDASGDLNHDGAVSGADLGILLSSWSN